MIEKLRLECLNSTDSKSFLRKKRLVEVRKRDVVPQMDFLGLLNDDDEDDDNDEKSFYHRPVDSPKNVEVLCGNISFL